MNIGNLNYNAISSEFETNMNLRASKISGPIIIYGNSGWANAKIAGTCTGNGTYSEPYVIEDLIINASGSGSCILIQNSDVYFLIMNCTVYNSGPSWGTAGIRLSYVENGKLNDNNCTSNFLGIDIEDSSNNSASGNIANNNANSGIRVRNSSNVTIIENTANDNGEIGIYGENSEDINITYNVANNNGWMGMYLGIFSDSIIFGNSVSNNTGDGGLSLNGNNNIILGNNVNNNNGVGIELIGGINNILYLNHIAGNLDANAKDDGTNNQWDNGAIGNYWDDYSGKDANDDGIGDSPYNIPGTAGVQDHYPIWDDGPEFRIPGYDIFFLFGILSVVATIISKKIRKS